MANNKSNDRALQHEKVQLIDDMRENMSANEEEMARGFTSRADQARPGQAGRGGTYYIGTGQTDKSLGACLSLTFLLLLLLDLFSF